MLHTETEVTCPSSRSARQSEACDPPAQPRARGLFGCPCVLSRGTRPPGQEGRESGSLGQLPELKRINPVWTSGGLCPRVPHKRMRRSARGRPRVSPAWARARRPPIAPGSPARATPLGGERPSAAPPRTARGPARGSRPEQGCRAAACRDGTSSCRPVQYGSRLPHVAPEPSKRGPCDRGEDVLVYLTWI